MFKVLSISTNHIIIFMLFFMLIFLAFNFAKQTTIPQKCQNHRLVSLNFRSWKRGGEMDQKWNCGCWSEDGYGLRTYINLLLILLRKNFCENYHNLIKVYRNWNFSGGFFIVMQILMKKIDVLECGSNHWEIRFKHQANQAVS